MHTPAQKCRVACCYARSTITYTLTLIHAPTQYQNDSMRRAARTYHSNPLFGMTQVYKRSEHIQLTHPIGHDKDGHHIHPHSSQHSHTTINKARQNVWAARTTPDCCAPAQVHTKRHNTHYNTCSPAYKTGLHHMETKQRLRTHIQKRTQYTRTQA